VNLAVIWHFLVGACELIHAFVCKGKTAIIVLKIYVSTIKNFVTWATGHPRFVHFCLCDCVPAGG
jgi:hypothetical protein